MTSGEQQNEETNQWNIRLARTFRHTSEWSTEFGVSAEFGQLYNRTTEDSGTRWAAALHADSRFEDWGLQLEVIRYELSPRNPIGIDDRIVQFGAFGVDFPVAASGTVFVLNVSRDIPLALGPIEKLTVYNDYSVLVKDASPHESVLNVTGCLVTAGKMLVYIDLILGRNHVFLGPDNLGTGVGRGDGRFRARFNLNVGFYF